jgi:molybdopterin-guanine dinucleotide biosynthesis protein A
MPNPELSATNVTGLVLAGGRGSRMGNVDKGLQDFGGQPMVAHVLHRLRPQVGALMINANQNFEAYAAYAHPVWPDAISGFAGPLAGLHTGLTHCDTPWIVTVPCDSPFLPLDLVQRLQHAQQQNDFDIAVAVTSDGETRQVQPVFCLARASLLPHLSAYLAEGGRKVDAWYRSLRVVEVEFEDEAAFRNINTLDELRAWSPK